MFETIYAMGSLRRWNYMRYNSLMVARFWESTGNDAKVI